MIARIYSPAKTAMQSGVANTGFWILKYEPETAMLIEPLMGYTSDSDMKSQIAVRFHTKEAAIAFANRYGIFYRLEEPHKPKHRRISYSDNFRTARKQPWTH
ncbi:MAG: NADH-ubiquinone oxidoreductase [Candidatus Tokpelaia sp. JSC188]|nr:MAG: NADH-ubiquinone oxidoreductase [Candidatus Tokpelaia sp. JSC188]